MTKNDIQTKEIKRQDLREFIENTHGTPFEISFIKKDGSVREMKAQTEVTIGLKGGKSTLEDHKEYFIVYDMEKEAYRAVNLNTTFRIALDGIVYLIKDD